MLYRFIIIFLILGFASTSSFAQVEGVKIIDDEVLPWITAKEPKKSDNLLLRIKFDNNDSLLNKEDKIAIDGMLKIREGEKENNFIVKSYTKDRENDDHEKEIALKRVKQLKQYLIKKNFDVDIIKFYIYGYKGKKFDAEFLDIEYQ